MRQGRERGLLPTGCTQELIKSFEIDTEGTCMPSSRGKGLMRLCEAAGQLKGGKVKGRECEKGKRVEEVHFF